MTETERFLDAVQRGKTEEVSRLLVEDASLLRAERSGVSAVRVAIYHGHPEVARILIDRGASLDVFDASATDQTTRLGELLSSDRSLANAVATDGFTPLGLAAFFGHADAARLLLASGADPNQAASNATKVAPLHSAVAGGNVEIVRALLARGADVHARQDLGFTALHGAAAGGSEEVVRLLLAHGSDRAARNDAGQTAADVARQRGKTAVAEVLVG